MAYFPIPDAQPTECVVTGTASAPDTLIIAMWRTRRNIRFWSGRRFDESCCELDDKQEECAEGWAEES